MSSAHKALDIRIFFKECRSLAAAGFDVTLIAQHPKDEVVDGVSIRGLSVPSGRRERMIRTTQTIYRLALEEDADLYHFHDPELIPTALKLKLRGKRVIYDVHENAPMDVFHNKPYLSPMIRRPMSMAVRGMEVLAGKMLDGIVTISDVFATRFPQGKTCVARNYPIVGERLQITGPDYKSRRPCVVFTGGLSIMNCAPAMVRAMSIANKNVTTSLVVVGKMEDNALADELLCNPGWQHTDFRGVVPQQKVYELFAEARVGLCLNQMRQDYVDISTNKLFDCMLAEIPVVVSPIPSWKATVEEFGCGIVLDENSPEAMAEAVTSLLRDPDMAEQMGSRGRKAVLSGMTWEAESAKLIEFYARVLNWTPGSITC